MTFLQELTLAKAEGGFLRGALVPHLMAGGPLPRAEWLRLYQEDITPLWVEAQRHPPIWGQVFPGLRSTNRDPCPTTQEA